MKGCRHLYICFFLLLGSGFVPAFSQEGFTVDIKKPKPYEERKLKAEKTGEKKFTAPRRVMQNTTTHYNYYFNAHNKLNEVLERARAANRDDYSKLLPFYNYSLDVTAGEKDELDSVIYKSRTGIVLHDLRSDWADDMYLLWGKAYYLQKQYDSAYQMFQFINYAFADKEKDGYYKYIGSRMDGNQATSISSKEDLKFPKGLIADAPIRNDALIWQIKTLIQSGQTVEAGSLIATLKADPVFPDRLKDDLAEVQAYLYYNQNMWDSAANHLSSALSNAGTINEKARWEYLIGQLYEKSGKYSLAEDFYSKAAVHTTDPVMDIYARLNIIRANKTDGENFIDQNIASLLKMAKRDKYADYRDIIYYMAAQMELERKNYAAAQQYFLKAAQYKGGNLASAEQGFLQLADLYFTQKEYTKAATFYDSVRIENMLTEEADRISKRKNLLSGIVTQLGTIERQDSLQRIAAMPEAEREAFLKKLEKQLRKQQGIKEGNTSIPSNVVVTDPFRTTNKGEWYFYNDNMKAQGAAAFKQIWGNRQNTDNWRRASSGIISQQRNNVVDNNRGNVAVNPADAVPSYSYEGLLANLPMNTRQVEQSNDSIANSLYNLGRVYIDDVEDYPSAIEAYDALRQRFPSFNQNEEVLFRLYYSYTKTGEKAKAEEIKRLLDKQYPESKYRDMIASSQNPQAAKQSDEATKAYEDIYNLFIEGKFEEAKKARQKADSTYGTTQWGAQLLYIEAVYYIRQREDSIAKGFLNTLIQQNSGMPIADKATNLLNVLNRRQQIEQELTALQIQRPVEEEAPKTIVYQPITKVNVQKQVSDTDTAKPKEIISAPKPVVTKAPVVKDTVAAKPAAPTFAYKPDAVHYVAIILNKVDVVYGNEAKNAVNRYNREKYYNRTMQLELVPIDDDNKLLIIGDFSNIQAAVEYIQKAKPVAASEIMPWLKPEKYSFTLISDNNLQVLKTNHDLNLYRKFLDQNLPVKF